MKTLINFASRSRPALFHKCMDNLKACFTDYQVALKVDRNDPTLKEYLSKAYPEIILQLGHSNSKVHAINRDIPLYNWDILVNTSDDIIWKPGAGYEIEIAYFKDSFLHFPEPYADAQAANNKINTISIVSIMDRIYYNRFGYVYHPDYNSLWSDNEATEVARRLGRYKFINKLIFEHMHPAAGKAVKDDQYRYTEQFNSVDKQLFLKRQKENFGIINTHSNLG